MREKRVQKHFSIIFFFIRDLDIHIFIVSATIQDRKIQIFLEKFSFIFFGIYYTIIKSNTAIKFPVKQKSETV